MCPLAAKYQRQDCFTYIQLCNGRVDESGVNRFPINSPFIQLGIGLLKCPAKFAWVSLSLCYRIAFIEKIFVSLTGEFNLPKIYKINFNNFNCVIVKNQNIFFYVCYLRNQTFVLLSIWFLSHVYWAIHFLLLYVL